jgi:hypothetical protein
MTGRRYFEVPCRSSDGSADWIQDIYNDEYRCVEKQCLISEIVADFNYFAKYNEGWADIVNEA